MAKPIDAVKLQERIRKQELADFKAILNTPEGRRFLIRIQAMCFENTSSYTGNAQTYFNEGMRQVSNLLKRDIEDMGIQGLDLKHKAEREYVKHQQDILDEIRG